MRTGAPVPPWRDKAMFVATCGGIGLLPKAPGSWGSAAALPAGWIVLAAVGWPGVLALAVGLTLLGLWACHEVLKRTPDADPPEIVIDEAAGQMLTLAAVDTSLWQFAVAFAMFRVMDIAKPFPVSWAERSLAGALGVMADDLAAALYALAGTAAAVALIGKGTP